MQAQPISPGVVVGSVTASATTGALIAMGHRLGGAGIPFAAIGAVLFRRAPSYGAAGLVLTGLVLHVVATFVWSFVYVWAAERLNRQVVAAMVVAAASFVGSWIVTSSSGAGLASVLPLGDRLGFALVLAGALALGMRYAFPARRNA